MKPLVKYLKEKNLLKDKFIYEAFLKIDRKDFIPEKEKENAYQDRPLPIGFGQTISQPQVVAFMLGLLSLQKGDCVLDVGFGSGWTTALLAEIVGNGKVIGIEKIPEIYETGKKNVEKYSFIKKGVVEVFLSDGRKGKEEKGPYDGILVSAADKSYDFVTGVKNQVKEGGRIVIPINSSVFLFTKTKKGFKKKEYVGFSFVPLV
jgi:protein-L-isoaspartate(D-aspartate) O-methyltransferase